MVFVAKGQVSVNDLFHASLLDDEKKEVRGEYALFVACDLMVLPAIYVKYTHTHTPIHTHTHTHTHTEI
jgi:hypothetical protein